MYCYKHSTLAATGICRHCYKGLCRECCDKNENYLACSEGCAEKAKDVEEMNERALRIYGIGKHARKQSLSMAVIANFCFGILFVALGATNAFLYGEGLLGFNVFFILIGVLFLFCSFFSWKHSKKTGFNL